MQDSEPGSGGEGLLQLLRDGSRRLAEADR